MSMNDEFRVAVERTYAVFDLLGSGHLQAAEASQEDARKKLEAFGELLDKDEHKEESKDAEDSSDNKAGGTPPKEGGGDNPKAGTPEPQNK